MSGARGEKKRTDRPAVLDLRGLGPDFSLLKIISTFSELPSGRTLEVLTSDRTISHRLAAHFLQGADRTLRTEPASGFQRLLLRRD